jgi:hypothetical protein
MSNKNIVKTMTFITFASLAIPSAGTNSVQEKPFEIKVISQISQSLNLNVIIAKEGSKTEAGKQA